MNDKIKYCGKSTIIFEKENNYYAKVKRCNDWSCPICGEKKKSQLLDVISYYQELYGMNNMLTLTTCSDSKELDKQFKKLLDCMSLLSIKRFISKNGGNLQSFNAYIEKIIEEECYMIWLLESHISKGKNNYIPRVHYAITLFECLKNHSLDTFFNSIGIKGKHFKKYYKIFEEKYSKYNRYIDLKNRNEKLGYLFYKDYEELFYFIYSTIKEDEKNNFYELAKTRVEYNVSRNLTSSKEIAYIRIMERTKKGRIHYHILTNFYVPYSILSKVSTIETFSSDQSSFDLVLDNQDNYESKIGEYLVKYITKDIGNDEENTTSEEDTKKRIITCSQNIKLNLSEHEDKGFKYYDEYWGTCEKEFMLIEETLFSFRQRLLNNALEQTPLYEQRKKVFEMVGQEKEKLEKEFKEKYLSTHDFIDTKEYKREKSQYVKEHIKDIETFSQKRIALLDKYALARSEIYRHKDSPPIIDKTFYYDDTLDYWQNTFIRIALTKKGSIALLGSAGTGKSNCIASLVRALPQGKKILCCAYTGKATTRLHELIDTTINDISILTIHKACNSLWGSYTNFRNNEYNPLPYDVCIIDEVSMVDCFLFYCLLNSLLPTCKIIVVGDFNQLPPCENSSLETLIEGDDFYKIKPLSKINNDDFSFEHYFTRVHLTKNYRSENKINQLAYNFLSRYEKDYFKEYRLDIALYLICTQNYKVLCNVNEVCRTINRKMTTNFPIRGCNGYGYKIGQEIMFLRNDMQRNFFNGMIGYITNYNETTRTITINDTIEISHWETKTLIQPTFATTIHKSQGSEMDKVILILMNKNYLLDYKIAYTGITRAKENILLMKENGVDEKKLYKFS